MRSRDVNFTVSNLKPNTRVYAFFDRVDVNADVGGEKKENPRC